MPKTEERENYLTRGTNELINFMKKVKLSTINEKVFKIDEWAPISQLLFDLGLLGLILFIFSFFILPWFFLWIYVILIILMLGFIFSREDGRYNFSLVIILMIILAFIPSKWGEISMNSLFWGDIQNVTLDLGEGLGFDMEDIYGDIQELENSPLNNIDEWVKNIADVLNWIIFLAIIGFGLTAVKDGYTLQFDKMAQKIAVIVFAIALLTIIYALFSLTDLRMITIWETVGSSWGDLMESIGLAQLDQAGNVMLNSDGVPITTPYSISFGLFKYIPFITIMALFILSYQLRKTDFKSVMFVNRLEDTYNVEVAPTTFSIPVLILLVVSIVYFVGYFLVTATPVVNVTPLITLAFYIGSVVVLFLLGSKVLILNRSKSTRLFFIDIIKYTLVGIFLLMLWYQVLTPMFYDMGLVDFNPRQVLATNYDEDLFTSPFITQFFIVALPETLIFQILIIGASNRIYYYFRKERLQLAFESKLEKKKLGLIARSEAIKITDSTSKKNLRNIARFTILQKEIRKIENQLTSKETKKVPFRFFIVSSMIGALIGSFVFADYHRFRMNIPFDTFWKDPGLGLTYFGAGFFLSLITMFNWISAILVHFLNNIIALIYFAG